MVKKVDQYFDELLSKMEEKSPPYQHYGDVEGVPIRTDSGNYIQVQIIYHLGHCFLG